MYLMYLYNAPYVLCMYRVYFIMYVPYVLCREGLESIF